MATTALADPDLASHPPQRVRRPVMVHRWDRLAFVHRPYAPEMVQRLLPTGLEADTFEGAAWVGIVPFRLAVRLPAWSPVLPWLSTTLETNVRTYVRGPDGRRGIFFLSLDASRLIAAVVAGSWYRIPYRWARLRFERRGRVTRYQSMRRDPVSTDMDLRLMVGSAVLPRDLSELERFLMCRWRLYSPSTAGLAVAEVDHEPWPLFRAQVLGLEEKVITSLGLPPLGSDLSSLVAHYSPGVDVQFGRRRALSVPSASSLPGRSTHSQGHGRSGVGAGQDNGEKEWSIAR